jgi:hypothetical protein
MADILKKKQIELQVYGKDIEVIYTGRLLGLLSPKEYDALFVKPELKNKIATVETTSLKSIGEMDIIEGFRIAMTVKKRNDEVVPNKIIFISEPLEYLSALNSDIEASFVGADSYFVATEVEA